jgi:hypothetical protein
MTDDRRQMADDRGQMTEDRGQILVIGLDKVSSFGCQGA